MNVLTKPRGRPDAVHALLRLLASPHRPTSPDDIVRWMVPAALHAGGVEAARAYVAEVRDAAVALGFIAPREWTVGHDGIGDWSDFTDRAHTAFCSPRPQLEANRDSLEVYAAAVVKIEREGFNWLSKSETAAEALRDFVGAPGPDGESHNFNKTQWLPWTHWMTALGLGLPGPDGLFAFLPHPAERLLRVARSLPGLVAGAEMDAPTFLAGIAREMPYLDGGTRYEAAWHRVGSNPPEGRLSRVLSQALSDLNRRREIELRYGGGDDIRVRRLSDDASDPSAFTTVRIMAEVAA